MRNLQYNEKEEKVLEGALIAAVNELERLWLIGSSEEIRVPVILDGMLKCSNNYTNDKWELFINDEGIYLEQDSYACTNQYFLASRKKNGKLKILTTIRKQDIIFLKEFEEIRKRVTDFVTESTKEKEEILTNAQSLIEKYQDATIEIDLPETINQTKIEVVEENGKKIGTLNFGNIALRIITSASIEFVDKKEKGSIKRK